MHTKWHPYLYLNFRLEFKDEATEQTFQFQKHLSTLHTKGGESIPGTGITSSDAVFLYDRNIPGFPYRSPTAQLTNLERSQLEHFENQLPTLDV